jgi:hypothetical protein
MWQALNRGDALVLFAAIPAACIGLCAALLFWVSRRLSLRSVAKRKPRLGFAWTTGALLGLVGLVCTVLVGPHLAAFFIVWSLLPQVLIFIAATLPHLGTK